MNGPGTEPILRFGIIGSGRMARTRAAAVGAAPRARLVAVASRNAETGAALAADHGCAFAGGIESLLGRPDLDAVAVCTHNDSHGALAVAALRAGRHALVEYPLALEARRADAALELARRRGLVLQAAYDQVWLGPHAALGEAIRREGPPLEVAVSVAWAGGPGPSAFRNTSVGGPPALVKSYYLYAVLEWLGAPDAHGAAVRYAGLTPGGDFGAAAQHVRLVYPGTLVQLSWLVGAGAPPGRRVRIELSWADRSLVFDGQRIRYRDAAGETSTAVVRRPWARATTEGVERFTATVLDGAPPVPDPLLAAAAVRLAAAGRRRSPLRAVTGGSHG
ncbi:MAG TPA: Gfo/Idh/MocA family oxidoreductase [Chloroflexota bacterium]|nr:Gfo/Idh/MocA family oxidoreductase [Chloroflexota bacterium]